DPTDRRRMGTTAGRGYPGLPGEPSGTGLREGALGGGGHAGRRSLPNAGGGGAWGDRPGLARRQGRLLPDRCFPGSPERSAATAPVEILGPPTGDTTGGGTAVAGWPKRGGCRNDRTDVFSQAPAAAASAATAAAAGANGGGDHGGQRAVRLAGGGRGASARPG